VWNGYCEIVEWKGAEGSLKKLFAKQFFQFIEHTLKHYLADCKSTGSPVQLQQRYPSLLKSLRTYPKSQSNGTQRCLSFITRNPRKRARWSYFLLGDSLPAEVCQSVVGAALVSF